MSDETNLHSCLRKTILNGLGLDRQTAWDQIKTLLSRTTIPVDDGDETSGQDICDELITGSINQECSRMIDLCSEYDNGLVLLRNVCCQVFRSQKAKKDFESSLRDYAQDCSRRLVSRQDFSGYTVSIANQNDVDQNWIDDLNQASYAQARHVVEAMSRPGEPLADDDQVEQFLCIGVSQDSKSSLKKILENKNQSVVDEFRNRLTISDPGDPQHESLQFLYIFVQQVEGSESLYRFKAELVEQGATIPLGFDLEREDNGAWPERSISDLAAYIVRWYEAANRRAVGRLSMEVFFPSKLLVGFHDFKIEIPESEPESSTKMLNLVFDCPYVLRSSDRALSAQKGELGPLRRKWQSLRSGTSVLHSLRDDSELDQGPFHSLLKQDYLAGILMLKNLPDDEGMRSRLINKMIDSGTPLLVWYNDTPKDDVMESSGEICDSRLNYFDQCLDLNGVQMDARQRIKAPIHLCKTERAAHRRFDLATEADCKSWIHRVNIFHDHPDRWPQLILYEQQPGGELRSEIY
jgi:hypothetical protein